MDRTQLSIDNEHDRQEWIAEAVAAVEALEAAVERANQWEPPSGWFQDDTLQDTYYLRAMLRLQVDKLRYELDKYGGITDVEPLPAMTHEAAIEKVAREVWARI